METMGTASGRFKHKRVEYHRVMLRKKVGNHGEKSLVIGGTSR